MSRINVYVRPTAGSGTMYPLPVANIKLPVTSQVTLQFIALDLDDDKEPFDLVGYDIKFVVRKEKYPISDDDMIIYKDNANIDLDNTGYFEVALTHDDMAQIPSEYWYSVDFTNLLTGNYRQSLGKFILLP